jgi:hypothetical protein
MKPNAAIIKREGYRFNPTIELAVVRLQLLSLRYRPYMHWFYKRLADDLMSQEYLTSPLTIRRLRAYIGANQKRWEAV